MVRKTKQGNFTNRPWNLQKQTLSSAKLNWNMTSHFEFLGVHMYRTSPRHNQTSTSKTEKGKSIGVELAIRWVATFWCDWCSDAATLSRFLSIFRRFWDDGFNEQGENFGFHLTSPRQWPLCFLVLTLGDSVVTHAPNFESGSFLLFFLPFCVEKIAEKWEFLNGDGNCGGCWTHL
jgi:hypothetical protein